MKLGLLEFGELSNFSNTNDVIEGVISYARRAEKLGFSRFWLSEHHPGSLIWSNPILMLSILGTQTNHIHIGCGGIMSALHSPYLIFDYFKQLSMIFPNRIDLGFAKGNAPENIRNLLLNQDQDTGRCLNTLYENNIIKTSELLEGTSTEENVISSDFNRPRRWILSSSCSRLQLALQTGSDVCMSTFHSSVDVLKWQEDLKSFKRDFKLLHDREPKIMLAFSGYFDHSDKKAKERYRQKFGRVYQENSNVMAGTPSYLNEKLAYWKETVYADEFIFKDVEMDNKLRKQTLNLLSKELL